VAQPVPGRGQRRQDLLDRHVPGCRKIRDLPAARPETDLPSRVMAADRVISLTTAVAVSEGVATAAVLV
jgi:hypothetical protein